MHRSTELFPELEKQLPVALDVLRQMVDINSWTGNREGVNRLGRLTAECFAEFGFTAEQVPSVNPLFGDHLVLTRRGQSAQALALVSHLDTVFPPEEEERNHFRWQPDGDRIFGPGTDDIKGGTALMWLMFSALRVRAPEVFDAITWRLFLNSSEETFSDDFGVLCRERFGTDTLAALVFEGESRAGDVRRLVVARKGRASWRVTVSGRGAHAGSRLTQGANAIVQLGQTIQQISALTDPARNLTFNVGSIAGGSGLNRVPHEAVAEGEFRAFSPEVFGQGKAALLALAGPGQVRSELDGYACQVKAEILTESRPWPRNANTDRLLALWQAAGRAVGLEVEGEERGGLSDGNLLWHAVPTIDGLGPWGDNGHCSERSADGSKLPEFVVVSSFVPKAVLNLQGILNLLQQSRA